MGKNKHDLKRIGIDARMYGPLGKGLGRYTQEIVDRVVEMDPENQYVVFLTRENFDEFQPKSDRIKKVKTNIRWYSLAEQILLPFYIKKEKLDLMHFPHFNVPLLTPVKFVVTIHDLILTKFPTIRASTLSPWLYKIKNFFYKVVIKTAVKRAKRIIAVSEFTKKDIAKQFRVKPDKIRVTYEGVADLAKGGNSSSVSGLNDTDTLLSYNIDSDFLLYVGNAYPHKNLEGLVEAFADFCRNNYGIILVLVGKEDYFYQRLKETIQKKYSDPRIIFPGYIPDEKLEILYQRAMAYIFPSFYEGFGLPPLEAMAKGCPVLSSNRSSMPEILEEAALYFDPADKEDIVAKIKRVVQDPALRKELADKGEKQAAQYSWQRCAEQTLEIYKNV
ncbi:MAG TPA: glycosyltransferase family 1 protein [Patescibacteria group bacterium]|nr:glycosyltransferase family 1 protein [Patescibacteria group bacterium]